MPIDPDDLGRLYRRHAPALRLYARQWGESDDLVHDAFLSLARQEPPPDRVLCWLYCVVRHAALAHLRGAIRRRRRERLASEPEAWFASADDQLDAKDAARLLTKLPREQREVIVARLWGGLTFDDVAQLVGCPLPTAHRRYHAGLTLLRERLACTRTHPTRQTT